MQSLLGTRGWKVSVKDGQIRWFIMVYPELSISVHHANLGCLPWK